MAQKGLWNTVKKRSWEDTGVSPKEDGNQLRVYEALHEENFLSSWLREGVEGEKVRKLNKKRMGRERQRENGRE